MPDDREVFVRAVEEAARLARTLAAIRGEPRMAPGVLPPRNAAAALLRKALDDVLHAAADLPAAVLYDPAPPDVYAMWARAAYSVVQAISARATTRPALAPGELEALERAAVELRAGLAEMPPAPAPTGPPRRAGRGISKPQRLIDYMRGREVGEYSEIKRVVHDNMDVEDGAVKTNLNRANAILTAAPGEGRELYSDNRRVAWRERER